MNKTVKGWVLLDRESGKPTLADLDLNAAACFKRRGELVVPATLTYEVPEKAKKRKAKR